MGKFFQVSRNGGYVVGANSQVDIERNSYSPHKFMLAAPDSGVAYEAGKDADNTSRQNGVIEARFYLEKEVQVEEVITPEKWRDLQKKMPHYGKLHMCGFSQAIPEGGLGTIPDAISFTSPEGGAESIRTTPLAKSMIGNRSTPGVTVEGSHSSKVYSKINMDVEDDFVPLFLYLRGVDLYYAEVLHSVSIPSEGPDYLDRIDRKLTDKVASAQPGTSSPSYCDKCGAKWARASSTFCHACGNKLSRS